MNESTCHQRIVGLIYAKPGCPAYIAAIGGLVAPAFCIAIGMYFLNLPQALGNPPKPGTGTASEKGIFLKS